MRPFTTHDRTPSGARPLAVLAALLLASGALGYWHAHGGAGPISRVAAVVAPFQRAAVWAVRGTDSAWPAWRHSRNQAAEDHRLRLQVRALQERNRGLSQLAEENQRLRGLLGLRDRLPSRAIAAAVIGRDLGLWSSALIVDRGRRDGLRPRQVAVGLDGLVGQVIGVSERTARVLPITDPASGVAAVAPRSREKGVLKGTGDACRLRYLSLHTAVRPGDAVITSGLGGIFPAGLPLGTVTRVERDPATSTSYALVRPSQDLNRTQEVLVTGTAAGSALSGSSR
jgi:rod shape-determining protein MreC